MLDIFSEQLYYFIVFYGNIALSLLIGLTNTYATLTLTALFEDAP